MLQINSKRVKTNIVLPAVSKSVSIDFNYQNSIFNAMLEDSHLPIQGITSSGSFLFTLKGTQEISDTSADEIVITASFRRNPNRIFVQMGCLNNPDFIPSFNPPVYIFKIDN